MYFTSSPTPPKNTQKKHIKTQKHKSGNCMLPSYINNLHQLSYWFHYTSTLRDTQPWQMLSIGITSEGCNMQASWVWIASEGCNMHAYNIPVWQHYPVYQRPHQQSRVELAGGSALTLSGVKILLASSHTGGQTKTSTWKNIKEKQNNLSNRSKALSFQTQCLTTSCRTTQSFRPSKQMPDQLNNWNISAAKETCRSLYILYHLMHPPTPPPQLPQCPSASLLLIFHAVSSILFSLFMSAVFTCAHFSPYKVTSPTVLSPSLGHAIHRLRAHHLCTATIIIIIVTAVNVNGALPHLTSKTAKNNGDELTWKYLTPITLPSFLPIGSSSTTPAQSPGANCVSPMKAMMPGFVPLTHTLSPILKSSVFTDTDPASDSGPAWWKGDRMTKLLIILLYKCKYGYFILPGVGGKGG